MGNFSYVGPGIEQASQLAIQRQQALQDQQRQTKLGLLQNAYANTTDPDQRTAIMQGISSLYPTPAHAPQFLTDLLHLKGRQQQAQQPQQAPQQAGASASSDTTGAAAGVPSVTNPAQVFQGAAPAIQQPQVPLAQVRQVAQAPTAADAWKTIAGVPSPVETQLNLVKQQAANAMALRQAEIQGQLQLARERAQMGVGVTPENRFLQQYAVQHGYNYASDMSPDEMSDALRSYKQSTVVPTWKSVIDGNNIYAVDAHNPNGQRTLIGHKDDLTSHTEYKTMQNPDGSEYLVPVTVWTKKGSSNPVIETQDQPQSPVSSNTPPGPMQGVSTPPGGSHVTDTGTPTSASTGAAAPPSSLSSVNNQIAQGNATSKKLNKGKPRPATGSNIPSGAIPFGGRPSELLKSDTQQYEAVAKEANDKLQTYQNAQGLLNNPNRKTDLELVFSWVRSNVQGAGRMTNTEIGQAAQVGSFGQRIQNAWSAATTGRLSPEIEEQFIGDIKRASDNAQAMASQMRTRVEREQKGLPAETTTPVSANTPPGPSGGFDWNSAPVHK